MGNKTNPNVYRYILNNDWCFKSYDINKKNIIILNTIKQFLNKKIGKFNYDQLYIEKLEKYLIITIYTYKPGLIIGKQGLFLLEFKKYIKNNLNFNSYINIKESCLVRNFSFLFSNLFLKIFKRENYKNFIKQYFKKLIKNVLVGVKIVISGRINGADISRKETFKKGVMPLQSYKKKIFYKMAKFNTKFGVIGIKIWFCYK
ncbi:30S ribosomal protein S3 [Candidatus Vidania fulgoroideorum]